MTHRWPQILRGRVLYSGHSDVSNWDTGTLRIETTPGEPGKVVLRGGYHGRYVPTGHLLYVHAGTLYGVRFDLDRLETTSSPVPVIEHIAATPISGSAQYSFASDGTLAYIQGSTPSADARIHWLTARGETSALKTTPGTWGSPRFSPDGKRIALQVAYGSHEQIAMYNLETDRLTQLTFDAANHRSPIWSRMASIRLQLGCQRSWFAEPVLAACGRFRASRAADNEPRGQVANSCIQAAARFGTRKRRARRHRSCGFCLSKAVLKRDGRRNATAPVQQRRSRPRRVFSGRSARGVHVERTRPLRDLCRPLEGDGGPWRVSTGGGAHPVWSRSANELLFTTEDQS